MMMSNDMFLVLCILGRSANCFPFSFYLRCHYPMTPGGDLLLVASAGARPALCIV